MAQTSGFSVDIELLRYTSDSLEIPTESITVKNRGGYTYRFSEDMYEIRYIVDSSSAKKVKAENFSIELDLSSALISSDGKYTIMPTVKVLDVGFTLYPISLEPIEVVIRETEN